MSINYGKTFEKGKSFISDWKNNKWDLVLKKRIFINGEELKINSTDKPIL